MADRWLGSVRARAKVRRTGTARGLLASVARWAGRSLAAFYLLAALGLLWARFFPPLFTVLQVERRIESLGDLRTPTRQEFQPLDRISPHLRHAVVAAEDARFFAHHGIDWRGTRDAMRDNWRRGRLGRGGSTITQQLVKNLFFGTRGGVLRKILEFPLAVLAELVLPKERILELYLNVAEWGPWVYGAEAAARFHYGTTAASLDRDRAARLAACLPAPRVRRPQAMGRRSAVIRRRMAAMGW